MIKNVLLDIDGVLWEGGEQILGAQKTLVFLEKNNYNFLFLTNISRFTVKDLSKKLKEKGISVIEEKIMSPIETTIEFVKTKNQNAVCFLIAENSIKEQFRKSGLKEIEN